MKMQLYWIPLGPGPIDQPGSFVFLGNASEEVAGFVVATDDTNRALICLWEPTDVLEQATVVAASLPDEEVFRKLEEVIRANPAVREQWLM